MDNFFHERKWLANSRGLGLIPRCQFGCLFFHPVFVPTQVMPCLNPPARRKLPMATVIV